jgi:hypothetical protein
MYKINISYHTKLLPFVVTTVTNFGGAVRRGTNNIFAMLKTSNLKISI